MTGLLRIMNKINLKPGMIHFSASPIGIQSVVTFGILITIYDKARCLGGAAHFVYPFRVKDKPSTALYGAPAVVGLLKAIISSGSNPSDLEVNIYGSASPENAQRAYLDNCSNNILVVREILDKKEIKIQSADVGGSKGRKVVFDTSTGETMIAKVDSIRSVDWMLSPEGPIERQKA